LADYSTFTLISAIANHKVNSPQWGTMIPGIVCSGIGMLIGTLIKVSMQKIFNRKYEKI